MSVSVSSSIYVPPSALTQTAQSAQVNGASDPDGDGDGGGHRAHRSRGAGGQMQNALMQALQSMGFSMPQPTTATAATASTSQSGAATDSDGDTDGSTSATSSIKKDLRQFMHALFQAVKSETTSNASSTSSTGTTSTDPKSNFAAGLSALISQVSNGTVPASLQSAFAKVVADLQPSTPVATGSEATGSSATASPPATLQALLTQLQQNLGYGASSSSAAVGNFLSAQA